MNNLRQALDKKKAAYETARFVVSREKAAFVEISDELSYTEEAQKIVQAVALEIQEVAHNRIASTVSRCLEMIFDEPYEFHIYFEQKRGRTEARLAFVRDGVEFSPLDSTGGGVVDVAAFALRLSCLLLARPQRRRLMVLDEPFLAVSAEYRPRVRQLLLELSSELNVQFVIVTHVGALRCGTVVEIE